MALDPSRLGPRAVYDPDGARLHTSLAAALACVSARYERVVAHVLDDLKTLEQQLAIARAEARRLRTFFDGAASFLAVLRGPDLVFEEANPAYLRMIGHDEVIGEPVRQVLPELAEQGYIDIAERVRVTGEPFVGHEVRLHLRRSPDGPIEEVVQNFTYEPLPDGEQGPPFERVAIRGYDVTEQHRLQTERDRALAEYRFLAETIPQQVWSARPDGEVEFFSDQALRYYGVTLEQLVGSRWQHFVHEDDRAATAAAWAHAVETGEPFEKVFRLRRHDGQYRWHLGRAQARRGPDGVILRWFGTDTDVHESKLAEAELAARGAYKRQVIGVVSHDLRNPLSAISMAAQLMERHGGLDQTQQRAVRQIQRSSERMARMIRDLLDTARAHDGHLPIVPVDGNLHALTRQVVDEHRLAHPAQVIEHTTSGDGHGRWDLDRVAQAIGNLVGNAAQHGGTDTPIRVTTSGAEDHVTIEVHNHGGPIDRALRARLFEPYQRGASNGGSPHGVGLGLYITREIVAAHGGTIRVTSTAESGTTFRVELPRHRD